MMKRTLVWGMVGVLSAGSQAAEWLPASADKLPRWHGFNLLNKFQMQWNNTPFAEEDFQQIAELGFNFVRLPMDYRTWIVDGDWRRLDEKVLKEIDQAVAWGEKYGIHVCINFHRAPGYTVAKPAEKTDLWTDAETQEVCALHWAAFARRYRGIPNERLSFNLFNEPSDVSGDAYFRVAKLMVEAIHREDPERLIIADGVQWGSRPCPELYALGIAQATRGYAPSYISHYKASWAGSWDGVPPPTWPRPLAVGWLAGDNKKELRRSLVIEGPFPSETVFRFRVAVVSANAHLVVAADETIVFDHQFVSGPGEGEWREVVHRPQWNMYQNVYDRDYEATVPAGTQRLAMTVHEGDWMTCSEIGLRPQGALDEVSMALMTDYGKAAEPIRYRPDRPEQPLEATHCEDRDWLWREQIEPWQAAQRGGVGVMVGEFGAFQHTPHDVVLRWMEDCLANWQRAGWGWALWNFHGGFGILDSGRKDVVYEDFHGHKLDRKMLDLLLKYR